MSSYVACPVCSAEVPKATINHHLDAGCPGSQPSMTPSSPTAAKREVPSGQDVVEIPDDSPVKAEAARKPPSNAAIAPLFLGGAKRKREPEAPASNGVAKSSASQPAPLIKTEAAKQQGGVPEKRQRLDHLKAAQPLAERLRPTSLGAYIGQNDIIGPGSLLRSTLEAGDASRVGSCVLWGPPGSGKTTLARLIASMTDADFKELSATSAGAADVRKVFEQAKNQLKLLGRKTVLFIDEIHRFTKPQQDLFLPFVENGWVQLIGATTENPSFKVNGALLSRCQVFTLDKLQPVDLERILQNALDSLPEVPRLPAGLLPFLADVADGDARQALNSLELSLAVCERRSREAGSATDAQAADTELMEAVKRGLRKGYDRTGEERYLMISALHKSIRGSDGSAAMYWLARMLTGGEDPLYVARRLIVVASEDVGMIDPQGLPLAIATYQACQIIGMPECRINLAHCVGYLSEAKKCTRSYEAYGKAEALANTTPLPPVPLQIRNAPTGLMKKLGYGKEYAYDPGFQHPVYNQFLPEELEDRSTYGRDSLLQPQDVWDQREDKAWDENKLMDWELKRNKAAEWEGRHKRPP